MRHGNGVSRTTGLLGLTALAILAVQPSSAQQTANPNWTEQERQAVAIVNACEDAWASGDAQKVASYMSADVRFSGGVNQQPRVGLASFIQGYNSTFFRIVKSYEITETYAAGGGLAVAVIQKRIDHVMGRDGKMRKFPYVGVYQVRDGKITYWLDMAIAPPPAGFGGAPRKVEGAAPP